MNVSAPFIKRPVATLLLTAALTLAGLVAYRHLPVAALPRIDIPTISVSTALPGASPEAIATNIQGASSITLEFAPDRCRAPAQTPE